MPISLDLRDQRVVVAGGGEAALAKLRLLAKSEASFIVAAADPAPEIVQFVAKIEATLVRREAGTNDISGAALVYVATDDPDEAMRVAARARSLGVLVNTVDDRALSDFLTPAIVDRDPVTVAIGTEGAAPVLARRIKADLEARLPQSLGPLASVAARFRARAGLLPAGRIRRRFWDRFFAETGPDAYEAEGAAGAGAALEALLVESTAAPAPSGHVHLIGAGPGDPELLTLKARQLLHDADVVVYDRLAATPVLELARREAELIETGKTPHGRSWRQSDINTLLIERARAGLTVARLKSGDPGVFGRLDEETAALDSAGVAYSIVPGVTAATAAAAAAGISLTRRGRNSAISILTGHDIDGFADHDWRSLARPGAAAAIYMGVRAATFLQGRLLMHGADPATPISLVENASRPDQRIVAGSLAELAQTMRANEIAGPTILFLGLSPRAAVLAKESSPPLAALS